MAKFLFQLCEICGCLAVTFQDFSRVSEQLSSAEPDSGFTTNLVDIWSRLCVWGREYPELPFCCRFLVVVFFPSEILRA